MTSSVSFSFLSTPSLPPRAVETIRSVGGAAALEASPAISRTVSPLAVPADGGLGAAGGSPPSPNTPRGSLLNMTV